MSERYRYDLIEVEAGVVARSAQVGIDPATVLMIVQAIVAVLQMLQNCRKQKVSWRRYLRISFGWRWARGRVREAVADAIGDEALRQLGGDKLINAIIARGDALPDEYLLTMSGEPK